MYLCWYRRIEIPISPKGRAVEQEAKGNASRSRVVISSKRIGTIPTISKMSREKDKIMNGPKNKK